MTGCAVLLLQWEGFQETLRAETLTASRIRWPKEFAAVPVRDTKSTSKKHAAAAEVQFVVSPLEEPTITVVL